MLDPMMEQLLPGFLDECKEIAERVTDHLIELEKGFAKRTTQEWVEVLNAKGVPSGPILDVKQVYEDEQIRHLKMAVPVKHPALGELLVQAPPVTLSRTPGAVRTPAPDTGEHNDQILTELGYSPADIDTLRKDKVI